MVKKLGYARGWHLIERPGTASSPGDTGLGLDHSTSRHTDVAAASLLSTLGSSQVPGRPMSPGCLSSVLWAGYRPAGTPNFPSLHWPFMPWGGRSIQGCASAPSQISNLPCIVPWQHLYFFSCFSVFFAIGLFHWVTAITGVIWGGFSVPLSKQLAARCPDPGLHGGLPCRAPHISDGSDPPWPWHRGKNISPGLGRDYSALHTPKLPWGLKATYFLQAVWLYVP